MKSSTTRYLFDNNAGRPSGRFGHSDTELLEVSLPRNSLVTNSAVDKACFGSHLHLRTGT